MGICVHIVFVIYMYLCNYIYYNVCIIYIHIHTQQNGDINASLYAYIYIHVAWGIPPAFLKLLLVICSQEHLSVGFFEKETVETIF